MAYSTSNKSTCFSVFPSSPASTNVFALFGHAQSPRDNHLMCEDLKLGRVRARATRRKESAGSESGSRKGLRKILNAI
ncbi:hypothetical protein P692DRAFT_20712296 [Suillus brevipes Sb2]|nr:hypothetical protein P692DRAFT_20712296 [Suillus brevipes Sb2]